MTKENLIKKLQAIPGNPDVCLAERKTEFSYGLLNSVSVKKVNFKEDPNSKTLATEKCIILDEE